MTESELQAIEARAEAATEGPWNIEGDEPKHLALSGWSASMWSAGSGYQVLLHRGTSWQPKRSDFEFIAHARTDIPALLAEVRRLRARAEVACCRDENVSAKADL